LFRFDSEERLIGKIPTGVGTGVGVTTGTTSLSSLVAITNNMELFELTPFGPKYTVEPALCPVFNRL
jgi:hypothetical protein